MRILRHDPSAARPDADPIFIGDVVKQSLVTDGDAQLLRVNSVTFNNGARNKWHRHAVDQVLVVTDGRGIVATEAGERLIEKDDVILIPAGERHWHGARSGEQMTHLSILTPGDITIEE